MPVIEMDFYSDWIEILRRELTTEGFPPEAHDDDQDICFRYFNFRKRSVSTIPREVLKPSDFTVPTEHQEGVDEIIKKLENGTSMVPHLSRSITDADYDDAMLNDWGIHHFHLGTTIDQTGFVERTGPLLFTRITNKHAYLLGIFGHGQWANQTLIEIIHNTWPDSINQFKLVGVIELFDIPTDQEISMLRSGGISTIVQTADQTVYAPMGGGITTSGLSVEVVSVCDRYARAVKKLEQYVIAQSEKMIKHLSDQGHEVGDTVTLKLQIINGQFVAVEEMSRVGYGLIQANEV